MCRVAADTERDALKYSAAQIPIVGSAHPYPKELLEQKTEKTLLLHAAQLSPQFHCIHLEAKTVTESVFTWRQNRR
jgi:hypothetical protein